MKELIRKVLASGVSKLPKGILTDPGFFELYQSRGFHALPVHFYQPIPNTAELPDSLWEKCSETIGVDSNLQWQSELLQEFSEMYLKEYHQISEAPPKSATEYTRAARFSGIDGAILYCTIRKYKPRKIVEIGSGYSTLLSLLALQKNREERSDCQGEMTAIEPYPKDFLKQSLDGVGQLIVDKVENVPLSTFEALAENDILFIDSSHTVKIGGDVVYEILEIIPRLKKGVLIHIHDIFMPWEYPKNWVKNRHIFWTEQYLLQAFLAFNRNFEILWSAGYMHAKMPEMLAQYFPYYDSTRQQAGSFWMRRCQ